MSSSTTAKKVTAREKARQRIAAQREEQLQREKADEADLAAILRAVGSQSGAARKRDAQIDRATATFDDAVSKARAGYGAAVADSEQLISERLAAMRERGQSVADLADLTEMSESDVRRHIKAHKYRAGQTPLAQPSPDTPPPADHDSASSTATNASTTSEALGSGAASEPGLSVTTG